MARDEIIEIPIHVHLMCQWQHFPRGGTHKHRIQISSEHGVAQYALLDQRFASRDTEGARSQLMAR
jgi:hypothetical protein